MTNDARLARLSPFTILSLLIAAAITVLGVNFLIHPHAAAAGYGVSVASTDADAFLRAKGVRDIASGLVLAALVGGASKRAVGLFLLAMTTVPLGDALVVSATGGAPAYAIPMHAGTALVMLAMALLMLRPSRAPGTATRG